MPKYLLRNTVNASDLRIVEGSLPLAPAVPEGLYDVFSLSDEPAPIGLQIGEAPSAPVVTAPGTITLTGTGPVTATFAAPTYTGTEPITVALAATLDGSALSVTGGTASIAKTAAAQTISAVWTLTGAVGDPVATDAVTVTVPAYTAPAAALAPTLAVVSATEITATLAADQADGGSAITDRTLSYSVNGGAAVTVTGLAAEATHTITGLTAGDTVVARMDVTTAAGTTQGATATAQTWQLPDQMAAPTLIGGAEEATLEWPAAPNLNGRDLVTNGYRYEITIAADTGFASVVASGQQADLTDTSLTPLAAGDYIARVWAVTDAGAGVKSAASAAETIASGAITTITDFSRDFVVFDGDMMNNTDAATVTRSGTTTADDGAIIQMRCVEQFADYEPALLQGRTGTETPYELSALVKDNAPALFSRFNQPELSEAGITALCAAYSGPGTVSYNAAAQYIEVRSGATFRLENVNLGTVGIDIRESSTFVGVNIETARGITARDTASATVYGFKSDNHLGRIHFTSLTQSSGAIVATVDSASVFMTDAIITRNGVDTFKLNGGASDVIGYVCEPMQADREVVAYDAVVTYEIGDLVRATGEPAGGNRIHRKITTAAAGTAPTQGASSEDWELFDWHYDMLQQANQAGEKSRLMFGYYNDQTTARIVGAGATDYKSVFGTAVFLQQADGPADLEVRGAWINSTQLPWFRRESGYPAGYTTTLVDIARSGDSPFEGQNQGDADHERITDLTGTAVAPSFGTAVTGEPDTNIAYLRANVDNTIAGAWTDLPDAVLDGAWSGSITVPRNYASWYRMEARVKGSAAAAAQTTKRFGVGLVVYHHRQSNGVRVYETVGTSPVPDLTGIGNDLQIYRIENRGTPTNPDTTNPAHLVGPLFVTDADSVTTALGAMGEVFLRNAPGLKVAIIADVKGGNAIINTLDDSVTSRLWANTQALIDRALSEQGQEIGAFYFDHWGPSGGTGDNRSVAGIEQQLFGGQGGISLFPLAEHAFHEAIPGLLTGRTHIVLGTADGYYAGAALESSYWTRRKAVADFVAKYPTQATAGFEMPMLSRFDVSNFDGTHFPTYGEYGAALLASTIAANILQATGDLAFTPPRMDQAAWAADGSYVDVWSSTGPITTIERQEALAEGRAAVNYPINPSPDPAFQDLTPGQRDVVGFQFTDFSMPVRTEIVDASGNLASAGRVRIYPDSGTFNASSGLYHGLGALGVNYAGNAGDDAYVFARDNPAARHAPIIDVGIAARVLEHGVYAAPRLDEGWITVLNDIPTASTTFTQVGTFADVLLGSSPSAGATFHARAGMTGGSFRVVRETDNDDLFTINLTSTLTRLWSRKDGTTDLYRYEVTGPGIYTDADGMSEVLIHINTTTPRIEVYRKDAAGDFIAYDPDNKWFDNTAFPTTGTLRSGRDWNALGLFSGTNRVEFVRAWNTENTGATPPAATPWRAVEARDGGAGAFDAATLGATGSSGTFDVMENGVARANP